MQIDVQQKFENDKEMATYLKQNSEWFKYLNRDSNYFKEFSSMMREKYKVRTSDKIETLMENVDLINSVLNVLK